MMVSAGDEAKPETLDFGAGLLASGAAERQFE
jgi:hypothetical protein